MQSDLSHLDRDSPWCFQSDYFTVSLLCATLGTQPRAGGGRTGYIMLQCACATPGSHSRAGGSRTGYSTLTLLCATPGSQPRASGVSSGGRAMSTRSRRRECQPGGGRLRVPRQGAHMADTSQSLVLPLYHVRLCLGCCLMYCRPRRAVGMWT